MSSLFKSSIDNRFIFLKITLLTLTFVSIMTALKTSAPVIIKFAIHDIPFLWEKVAMSFLRPLYLYLVINFIILTIAVSSKMQSMTAEEISTPLEDAVVGRINILVHHDDGLGLKWQKRSELWHERAVPEEEAAEKKDLSEDEQKPLVSERFGHQKILRTSPEGGKSLGVLKPKRQESLESTWKKITEGRPMPLCRRLKKHETSESQNEPPEDERKKSKVNRAMDPSSSERGKLPKDASPDKEELNRRVEAFINKFNEEMRMQRLESLQKYQDMIKRGIH